MVQILLVLRILGKKNATELDPIHCNTMPFLISGPTLAISNTLNFVWSNPTLQRTYQESRLLRATILSCVDFYVECLLWIGYKCFCRKTEAFMCVENFSQHFVSPWILDICCCSRVLQYKSVLQSCTQWPSRAGWWRMNISTGCPTIEYSLCFCYFAGFYSS